MILYPDGRVEGTPEELAQWKEMMDKKNAEDYLKKFGSGQATPWKTEIISNNKIDKCPNEGQPCFCTGQCMQ